MLVFIHETVYRVISNVEHATAIEHVKSLNHSLGGLAHPLILPVPIGWQNLSGNYGNYGNSDIQ